jgi:3-oxoacid CoA-transferase A subunit
VNKVFDDARTAVADIADGASIAVGGFGLCGIPQVLVEAVHRGSAGDLTVVSNNCGTEGIGSSILLESKRIRRLVASYVGENKELERQYLQGEVEIELTPQGSLAEKLRAGGSGIAAFYTRTGVGTMVADGGLPLRHHPDGRVATTSAPKPTAEFTVDGVTHTFVLEEAIRTDFALVRAWKGDRHGNLVFNKAARNFNPVCATAGRITIAEVENLVEPGDIDPDEVHLPGIYVQRIVALTPEQAETKSIERRTVRLAPEHTSTEGSR